jgi:hypothetical protein
VRHHGKAYDLSKARPYSGMNNMISTSPSSMTRRVRALPGRVGELRESI